MEDLKRNSRLNKEEDLKSLEILEEQFNKAIEKNGVVTSAELDSIFEPLKENIDADFGQLVMKIKNKNAGM